MDSNQLSALAGVLLSLVMSYFPGLREWFAAKDSATKSLVMLGLLALVAVGSLLYKCNLGVECITANWQGYATALFAAAVANQTTYALSPATKSVKAAKTASKG